MDDFVLKVSYYGVGVLTLLIAAISGVWLGQGFARAIRELPFDGLRRIFGRSFFTTVLFMPMAGFFSVSIRGCSERTYAEIAADHAFIARRAQEQLSEVFTSLSLVCIIWGILLVVAMSLGKRRMER